LIVEDEARVASFLVKGYRQHGYEAEWAPLGAAALHRAGHGVLDLIVLDLGLPDMDGSEVLRRLRTSGDQTPVIVVTARAHLDDRVAALDLGGDDFLAKPFSFAELMARSRALLRTRRPTRKDPSGPPDQER